MADLWGSMGLYSLLLHFRVQSNPKLLLGHLEEDDVDRLGPTGQKYGTIWGCPTAPHRAPPHPIAPHRAPPFHSSGDKSPKEAAAFTRGGVCGAE